MKRLLLTLTCIISVIYLFPIFLKAYTAPDGNDYTYKLTTVTINRTWWMTLYSNDKICFCESAKNGSDYYAIGKSTYSGSDYIGIIYSDTSGNECTISGSYPSNVGTINASQYLGFYHDALGNYQNASFPCSSETNTTIPIFDTYEECYNYLTAPDIDFDTIYYDPTIPTPEFMVTMERPTPWEDVSTDTNFFDVTWNEYAGYYVQIGYKFGYPNGMKVGLVDGQTTYTPLTYANSQYIDLWSMEELHDALYINTLVNGNSFELESEAIQDSDSWQTSVPIWANTFTNSAYTNARNKWNTKMRYCWPLYGLKLEIFERLFYVADGVVYVGAWKHWNNTYPSDYQEEVPNNYQVGNSMPGYSNISNNTDYQEQEYTETSIGTQTGTNTNPITVINNLTPNYPNYPTAVTYNHDNILLQIIQTAKNLPQFFGDFSAFCASVFAFIPSEIWSVIAFGFLCSIFVMIVKVL